VGWRLLIFVVLVAALMFAKSTLIRRLPQSSDQAICYLVDKILMFAVILLASWIMAKIEARTIADYVLDLIATPQSFHIVCRRNFTGHWTRRRRT